MLTTVQSIYNDRTVVVDDVEKGPRPSPGKSRATDSSDDGLIRERIGDDPTGRFAHSVEKPLLECSVTLPVPCGGLVKLIQSFLGELDPTHAGFDGSAPQLDAEVPRTPCRPGSASRWAGFARGARAPA